MDEDCRAGDKEKFNATGLVEASFFLLNGMTTDFLKLLTMFLNARGDSFEVRKQVYSCTKLVSYVPDLYQGGPPMATVIPCYHDMVQEMKKKIARVSWGLLI